jgi:hypothetical protein
LACPSRYQIANLVYDTGDNCDATRSKLNNRTIACSWLRSQDKLFAESNLRAAFIGMFGIHYLARDCDILVPTAVDLDLALSQITAASACSVYFGVVSSPRLACSSNIENLLKVPAPSLSGAANASAPNVTSIGMTGSIVSLMTESLRELMQVTYLAPPTVTTRYVPPSPAPSIKVHSSRAMSKSSVIATIAGAFIAVGALAAGNFLAVRYHRRKRRERRTKLLANKDLRDPSTWAEVAVLRGSGKDPVSIARMAPGERILIEAKKTGTLASGVTNGQLNGLAGVANPLVASRQSAYTVGASAVGRAVHLNSPTKTIVSGSRAPQNPSLGMTTNPMSGHARIGKIISPLAGSSNKDKTAAPSTSGAIQRPARRQNSLNEDASLRRSPAVARRRVTYLPNRPRAWEDDDEDDLSLGNNSDKPLSGSSNRNIPGSAPASVARYIALAETFKPSSRLVGSSGTVNPLANASSRQLQNK